MSLVLFISGMVETSEHWGGVGWGLTDFLNGYKDIFPLEVFKTKFASLLLRFIMTIDGKCMIS